MILHRKCPICSSQNLKGYALDCYRSGPHISRIQCKNCKLVFANPMADASELAAYYRDYYQKPQYENTQYGIDFRCVVAGYNLQFTLLSLPIGKYENHK